MNWDRIEGNWKQFNGNGKQQWAKLTDDQLDVIEGKRDQLFGKIQETARSRKPMESSGKRRRNSFPPGGNARTKCIALQSEVARRQTLPAMHHCPFHRTKESS